MRIGPFGLGELLIIAVVVLLLFGPKKLPEMARGLTKAVKDIRRGLNEVSRDLQDEFSETAGPAKAGTPDTSAGPGPLKPAEGIQARSTAPRNPAAPPDGTEAAGDPSSNPPESTAETDSGPGKSAAESGSAAPPAEKPD